MFCVQSRIHFQSYCWFIRLRFDRQLRFAAARIRSVRELGKQNVHSFIGRAVAGSVLIEHARAGRPSLAMKLRRELSPPVFVVVVNYRRPLIASRVSCASERKLFFSSARWGWGSERGLAPPVRAITSTRGRKNGILIFGRW